MGKKKAITNEAITNEALERRCWKDLAIAIILQALNDYTALDDCVPLEAIGEVDGYENFKRFCQKDAFLFLNSSWFKLLNPTKFTGNELISMARRFKNKRKRHISDDIFIRIGLALQKTAKSDSVRRTSFYL